MNRPILKTTREWHPDGYMVDVSHLGCDADGWSVTVYTAGRGERVAYGTGSSRTSAREDAGLGESN